MKISFMITCFILTADIVLSQRKDSCYAGVYLSQKDFLENRFSHKINEQVKGNKFDFLIPANLTLTIKMVDRDSVIKFKPGSIYGYSECGSVYRYFLGKELNVQEDYYKIEETKGLIIYSSLLISGEEKFYSRSLISPIHRLTMTNLEDDFKDQPDFIHAIRKIKNGDGGLGGRDDKGAFLINKIYQNIIEKGNKKN